MRVILKPSRFTYDQIEYRLVGPGGASLASDADYPSAYLADAVIRSTGVGPLNGTRLSRMLDASSVTLAQSVSDDAIEFTGHTSQSDVEMVFQLLYLYFTSPRADTVAFRRYRDRAMSFSASRAADPDAIFYDTVAVTTAQRNQRVLRSGGRFIDAVDLSKSLAFWSARMSNAASFTLVMTGDFTLDLVRPLVERYLASLPAGIREQPRDNGIRSPSGIVRREIRVGAGPKAKTQIILSGPYDDSVESNEALGTVRDIAKLALDDRLRETLGGTYGVTVGAGVNLVPPSRYTVTIEFEASPTRIDSLANAALAELDRLRTRGPTMQELEKTRAAEVRNFDGKLKDNAYWATELSWHARMRWPLATIATHQKDAEQLTMEGLQKACATYLGTSQYVRVTMYPRNAAARAQ
jgi:zinc protease